MYVGRKAWFDATAVDGVAVGGSCCADVKNPNPVSAEVCELVEWQDRGDDDDDEEEEEACMSKLSSGVGGAVGTGMVQAGVGIVSHTSSMEAERSVRGDRWKVS